MRMVWSLCCNFFEFSGGVSLETLLGMGSGEEIRDASPLGASV
jgi:hypothetical protein